MTQTMYRVEWWDDGDLVGSEVVIYEESDNPTRDEIVTQAEEFSILGGTLHSDIWCPVVYGPFVLSDETEMR